MKKIIFCCLACLMLNACSSTTIPAIKTRAKNPIEMGDKVGSQCSFYILGLFGPFGDMSIPGAATNGGIQKVTYYDTTSTYYVLYSKRCLNIYGY